MSDQHQFAHSRTSEAEWTSGLRKMFDYRDLGVKTATNGDYVAHIIRANGKKDPVTGRPIGLPNEQGVTIDQVEAIPT